MADRVNDEKVEYIEKLDGQIHALDRILKMDSGTIVSGDARGDSD